MSDDQQGQPMATPPAALQEPPLAPLYAALAKAQGAFGAIVKNRNVTITMKSGGSYRFRYADLEEILSKTRAGLCANGLSLMQLVTQDGQVLRIITTLAHASGATIVSNIQIPKPIDGDIKSLGALISYWRRYVVAPLLGVAADDDLDEADDGDAGEPPPRQAPLPKAAPYGGYRKEEPPTEGKSRDSDPPFEPGNPDDIEAHEGMRLAVTISELAKIMSGLTRPEKGRYASYYSVRQRELQEGGK